MGEPPAGQRDGESLEPSEVAFRALHGERELLERALTLARQEQRFGPDPEAIEQARTREMSLLRDLDRVLTLIRAAEYRRRPGARRW